VSGVLSLSDGFLSYDDTGTGKAVVLLHAGLLDRRMWEPQVPHLVGVGVRVVAYDARAHGHSSTPGDRVAHHEDLGELLAALALERPTLIGCSLGARTAIDYSLLQPEQVAQLILVSPGVSGMEFRDEHYVREQQRARAAAQAGDAAGVVEAALRQWVDGPRRQPSHTPTAVRKQCAAMMLDTLRAHYAAGPTWRDEHLHAVDRLAELRPPVTVVTGELDMQDILDVADRLSTAAPGARRHSIPAAGHMLCLEQPDLLNGILSDVFAA
jgi:3-oxoadipate enol-lactonase